MSTMGNPNNWYPQKRNKRKTNTRKVEKIKKASGLFDVNFLLLTFFLYLAKNIFKAETG